MVIVTENQQIKSKHCAVFNISVSSQTSEINNAFQQIINWCIENFGPAGLDSNNVWHINYLFYEIWINANHKDKIILFKLRWI